MTSNCPVCSKEVNRRVPLYTAFRMDTRGTIGFCVGKDALYVHGSNTDLSSFSSYNEASEESIENLVASGTYPLRIEEQYNVERLNIDEYY